MVQQRRFNPRYASNISFWVGIAFVAGSIAWVVNGFLLYLPLITDTQEYNSMAAWWAFAGGTLFEAGGYLMVAGALNAGHEGRFGAALRRLFPRAEIDDLEKGEEGYRFRWVGWATWRDIGFMASFIQLLAASIFWISTITGIPNVIPNLPTNPPLAIADVFYWTPQVIGGSGFIISSVMFMLEAQRAWWALDVTSLAWHVGFWNLIGAFGFTLCGALGYGSYSSTKVDYQSVLSTFWGSWAFLIGSIIQMWDPLFPLEDSGGPASPSPSASPERQVEKGQNGRVEEHAV